ncbi:ATP-dependent sacrificial sulfur transferase LarE [Fusobacterium ulcerans]|uniref:ATP-dependent sacrificial sulfur transferase LarE n=1 Tax=Fusobacterium ulcerans TaxID=861 RepID=UPI001D0A0674|nr:ATP-dependent sacrificial sulfur transferase LarE [Fusobacterium ulcerans]MCB8566002.1 ATP-dependent sacrificial sulfur transferase LarE [Fusobacterium ulcerans]MCB8649994.1 ATP-dependent sacrificial sulfur transferase LarE [Fusobacterium ulcerans]
MKTYEEKCSYLQKLMEKYTQENVVVAFSGGVDSSLLLKTACINAVKNGTKVFAVTMHTTLHTMNEIESSKETAGEVGAEHLIISVDELKEAGIENNPVERCYLCKKYLFQKMKDKAESLGVKIILDGTNEDDLHMFRPGLKALKELEIKSPLAESDFSKTDVRKLAEEYGLSVSKKPSTPCLATRFPYGSRLSYEEMKKVEKGEDFLKNLGLYNVRLRVHNDIARIEVDKEDIVKIVVYKEAIISYLKELGYRYITLDLEEFRSGSMDYFLENKREG